MRGILLIAQLTWLEARRRRIALAAVVCGLLFLVVFATGVYFSRRYELEGVADLVQQRLTYHLLTLAGLYVVNFLTVAVAILLPVDSLSGEISSGVIQTLASKPIERAAIVLGKWLAYWCMTAAYLVLMAGGVVLSMRFIADFSQPNLLPALALMMLGASVLLTVTMACGVRFTTITNGIVAFAFYGIAFIAGWMEQILSMIGNTSARHVGTLISLLNPADAMWRRAAYELQPPVMRALQFGPFGVVSVPSVAMIVWTVVFVVAVLTLAVLLFRRRPL